jgi:hypothetical protein
MHTTFAICNPDTREAPLVKGGKEYPPVTCLYFLQNRTILGALVWASDRETAAQFPTRATAATAVRNLHRPGARVMRIAVDKLSER